VQAPDGTLVLYTLGAGLPNGAQVNCSAAGAGAATATLGALRRRRGAGPPPLRSAAAAANFTVHSAPSPRGPWAATTVVIEGWNATWNLDNWNPAPVILGNGSVRVMAHTSYIGWTSPGRACH
jgi:hypothetical protein